MIYNQWYVILESKEVKRSAVKRIKRLNLDLALWRNKDGIIACIDNRCCHRGASLAHGKVKHEHLECPFHGFLFNSSGKVSRIPANGKNKPVPETMKVKAYSTYENFDLIWLWWGDEDKKVPVPRFFEELADFSFSSINDHWNVHYSRAIENQLDVVHLPFVHSSTIGKGNKTLVNGPVVELENDVLTFYVDNRFDDGLSVAKKPSEIENYKDLFKLQFIFPNIWQNFISDKVRVFAAFVPIDDHNTKIYIRFYQQFMKIPLLKGLVKIISNLTNKIILRQDKRVVITQIPDRSEHKMNEKLIVGDLPIIEYRKYRDELKRKNIQ